ncbi:putative Ran exchange factor Prp20/Pim1 [Lepidopterella palustris CBS 459.81]|uniref:Putative Ran exchange factor Prp20/Pim1 n=1 Tax=Lepidopterella palustris CBS 459.81 TaxID=1314670 RepID=A0A8E2ELX1_9PEZI|nr:putative Ran exchange factor Prp20/Pim1 [Lepidopterella palustris CBS 459.81]
MAPVRKSSRVATTKAKATADAAKPPAVPTLPAATKRAKAAAAAPKANTAAKRTTAATKASGSEPKATATDASKKRGRPKKDEAESTEPPTKSSNKRKTPDDSDETPAAKKVKVAQPKAIRAKVAPKPRLPKLKVIINQPRYTDKVNVYVFGEGSSGELGLGNHKGVIDVKRPRLNPLLKASEKGIVRVATGGMHCVALSHDNKIYTWGVNDQGALGRETDADVKMRDIGHTETSSDSDDDEDDDAGLNPKEAEPTAIPTSSFPPGTTFVDVAAGDSISFALTNDGFVYGWGTFRKNEGILGFDSPASIQRVPKLIPQVKKITKIACGANHVLALDNANHVFAWGSGQQNQLGRRMLERAMEMGLVPTKVGFHGKDLDNKKASQKMVDVSCGEYHSFAIGADGHVWAFGANNFGETGIADGAGADKASIVTPTIVHSLGQDITCIKGGSHHNVAVNQAGECLVWGRVDGYQMGIPVKDLCDDDVLKDKNGSPKILTKPTPVPNIVDCTWATCGSDHSIAITKDGKAYSWGFSANYQTGQGTDDDIEVATLIDNTAVRDQQLNWAGAGGQYSIITALATEGEAHKSTTNAPTASG